MYVCLDCEVVGWMASLMRGEGIGCLGRKSRRLRLRRRDRLRLNSLKVFRTLHVICCGRESLLRGLGSHTRDFTQTPVSLFRFSALTFNGHKIHYSKEWCQQVEGHRDIVVHGPLNLINMLDFWRDT